MVDKYGDSVARSFLPGGDFIRAHNELETLVKKIFQRAGLQTTMQPLNIFHGKIPGPAMARYNSLHAKEAIIPDILVHNYPLKARGVGHLNGEAIFDIKTVRIDKNGTIYPRSERRMKRRGVDSKLEKVQREYSTRAEKFNKQCDNDINSTPFTDALKISFIQEA